MKGGDEDKNRPGRRVDFYEKADWETVAADAVASAEVKRLGLSRDVFP